MGDVEAIRERLASSLTGTQDRFVLPIGDAVDVFAEIDRLRAALGAAAGAFSAIDRNMGDAAKVLARVFEAVSRCPAHDADDFTADFDSLVIGADEIAQKAAAALAALREFAPPGH